MNGKGIFDWILDCFACIAGILFGCVVIIKFTDIILRYFLNKPLTWDIEVTEYILFFMAFFGAAWLLREKGHVRIDILDNMLSQRNKTYLHIIHSVIGALVSIILCLMSFMAGAYSYRDGLKVVKIYAIGKYYFLFTISFGFLLLFVEFIRQFNTKIHEIRRNNIKKGD
ncbi:MAG TPA: TRAP transporter small permease [Syntrophorhabdaceae bacterium]|nr:TRAP transporter small permease [Syntrophorhabdaceae bacterium]